jgi:hypothetical protein
LIAVLGVSLCLVTACSRPSDRPADPPSGRERFATPDEAAKAVMGAFETNDVARLTAIFGPDAEKELSSGDPVSDRRDRQVFAVAMRQSWKWNALGADRSELVIGDEEWPLPIPLAKAGSQWEFDSDAGKEELLSRRVGRNELKAIEVSRAYVRFQQEYASQPRDGKAKGLFAQKLRSTPGRQDGLYWRPGPNQPRSPMGGLVADATAEGYDEDKSSSLPFYGYYFRILTAQGAGAKGGAKNYVVKGQMSGGFGLIAFPAEYGRGGIKTFIVNQDGVVFETDLGDDTAKVAPTIGTFDPGEGWSEVKLPS